MPEHEGLQNQAPWYVIYTKPREEQRAVDNLRNQGYTCFLSTCIVESSKNNILVQKTTPLFPRYIFIQMQVGTSNWSPLRSTKGVAKVVEFGGQPARMPTELMRFLQSESPLLKAQFQANEVVRITSGAFAGYEGVFQKIVTTENAEVRAMVLLEFLSKKHKVNMPIGDLKSIL